MKRNPIATGVRIALFLAWSVFIIFLWLVRRIAILKADRAKIAASYSLIWSRGVLRLLGLKVCIEGTKPPAPFFLVTNHLGYLDIPVLASQMPCTFVAKSEVAEWPLFGTLAKLSGTLFINRETMRDTERVNARIQEHFSSGGSLLLFPEGTSTNGNSVAPFRSSLLNYPVTKGMPVHGATIQYFTASDSPPASESMCWWGDMTLLPHFIQLFRMTKMKAVVKFNPEPVLGKNRKELAEGLHQTVSKGLESFIK